MCLAVASKDVTALVNSSNVPKSYTRANTQFVNSITWTFHIWTFHIQVFCYCLIDIYEFHIQTFEHPVLDLVKNRQNSQIEPKPDIDFTSIKLKNPESPKTFVVNNKNVEKLKQYFDSEVKNAILICGIEKIGKNTSVMQSINKSFSIEKSFWVFSTQCM